MSLHHAEPKPAPKPAAAPPGPTPSPSESPDRFLNRDLSWLEFNRRVLHQALDPSTPLLERVKFLAIFTSNLDEFFMKRVGQLKHWLDSPTAPRSPDGKSPRETLAAIRVVVTEQQDLQGRCYEEDILPALRAQNIHLLGYADLDPSERRQIDTWFNASVFPILTPLAVDPGHRFPFISNLSENLGILLSQPGQSEHSFARVKIPDVLPRLVSLPPADAGAAPSIQPANPADPVRVVHLEEVIRNNLDDLFPGMTVHEVLPFRVTRNAAVEHDDDSHDLIETVEAELKMRRFARAVRIELCSQPSKKMLDTLVKAMNLSPDDVYQRRGPLEYGDLYQIADLDRPELRQAPWRPVTPPRLATDAAPTDAEIFSVIRKQDVFLHHPYESFTASVERFIAAASRDPDVLAIKQTLYRTSRDSPFVASLIRAAEAGKQVACLVEVRARFDEGRNVRFARMLEKAGVHVAYGVVGLKTHCKCSLVVRREGHGLRAYAHLGTGNYHPSTAQLYTDVGLLTCDEKITEDVVSLFNFLTGRSLKREYNELLVAPFTMRDRFVALIDAEIAHARAGRPARIIAKMNALEDTAITDKLYEASRAGVRITLIVRGFCCLRPGVPGLSDNIRVLSVVGRFLEHSRIFHFAQGTADPAQGAWLISSADWMYRNLSGRVEVAVPVKDESARKRLARILEVMLQDHRCAWDLTSGGPYTRRTPPPDAAPESPQTLGTFQTLMRETLAGV
jgi:polyphosphate kinase